MNDGEQAALHAQLTAEAHDWYSQFGDGSDAAFYRWVRHHVPEPLHDALHRLRLNLPIDATIRATVRAEENLR